MKIVSFAQIKKCVINSRHTIEEFQNRVSGDAQIVIMDINSIFDFEENKHKVCTSDFKSIAIVDDDDFEVFKNFGIDAWIKGSDLNDLNSLLNLIEKRYFQ